MKKAHLSIFFLLISLAFVGCKRHESKEDAKRHEKAIEDQKEGQLKVDQNRIKNRSQDYQQALNKKDIDALVNFWADEAVYRNPLTGSLADGKEEIRKEYEKLAEKMKGASVEMKISSVEFPYEDKAVEEGKTKLLFPGKKPIESDYKIVYVKREGIWQILNISRIDFGAFDVK